MFIDSHCHLDRLKLEDFDNNLDNVIDAASAENVNTLLCVSVTIEEFPAMAEKTAKYDHVWLTCGAHPLNKPLIIHTRDAQADTLAILRAEKAENVGGILHCFTESWEMAEQAIAMGFYISFSGIVTFKNASALREVAKKVPADRFLIETDAPYLAPVPHRGKQNQPAYVVEVAKHLASIRGTSVAEIAQQSSDNFHRLFPRTRKV